MKKLITILAIAAALTAQAQTFPLASWKGLYLGSDTLTKPNGDQVMIFGYITNTEIRYVDTAVSYRYVLHKVIITDTDTTFGEFRFNEYYGKTDVLKVGGVNRTGLWFMGQHYPAGWKTEDKNIARALFRANRDVIGW